MATKKVKITVLTANWFVDADNEERQDIYAIGGAKGVIAITEQPPKFSGDKHHYVVEYEDGKILQIFNADSALWEVVK